jgi:hypothetical protein
MIPYIIGDEAFPPDEATLSLTAPLKATHVKKRQVICANILFSIIIGNVLGDQ